MLHEILIVWLVLIGQMSVVWMLYRFLKNPSIVDVAWSIGLMIAGYIYLFSAPSTGRIAVLSGLLTVWGARLACYLWYTRVRVGKIDNRYTALSENWKIAKPLGYFLNFQLQGLLILIIASVFLFATQKNVSSLSILDGCGIVLTLVGIIGESIADWQLYQFQKKPLGKVCNVGLWQYCRHPNYYAEWLVWCGFTLFALKQPWGWVACVSPVMLYLIMTEVTGPMTERGSLQSRGDAYRDYQRTTPMFFPFSFKKFKQTYSANKSQTK